MAVLVEAISVIIKRSAIDEKFPGEWNGFLSQLPNKTMCADSELVRIGFMSPVDVESYVKLLESHGIQYKANGPAIDLVVADQQRGFAETCDWASFGRGSIDGNPDHVVAGCVAVNSSEGTLVTPDGWEYEGSLSQTFTFTPAESIDKSLKFLRHEDGLDVYLNELNGKEVYMGRTGEK